MKIRKYEEKDKKDVLRIHWETGFMGKSMSKIYTKRKLWAKEASYYINKEPESIFVAEDVKNKKVVGYLFGCLDDKKAPNPIKGLIPKLTRYIFTYPFMNTKNRKYARNMLSVIFRFIVGKEKIPEDPKDAGHIHINLLPKYRGKGIGSKLLKKYISYAKKKGVKRIHAGSWRTRLNDNVNFWKKNAFKEYAMAPIGYWKMYYPKEDIKICIYLKTL